MTRFNITNMLRRAAVYLSDKMEVHATEEIEYERPGVGSVLIPAVIGNTQFSQDTQTGFIDRIIRNDYIVKRELLEIEGELILPERNDIIRQELDDGTIYEGRVLGEQGMPHYKEADEYGVALRIHTKREEIIDAS